MLLLRLHPIPFSLLLHPCCPDRFSFPRLLTVLLCLSPPLLRFPFSLFRYTRRLLHGYLMLSGGGDILQSCSLGLAFALADLGPHSLPALPTTHVANLLAWTATCPRAVTIYIGIQKLPSDNACRPNIHHLPSPSLSVLTMYGCPC